MNKNYSNIFTPLTVKTMTLKNRVVMTPMGTNYGEQNGEMSFLHIHYYEQRAKGGTGLLTVENASVDSPLGSNGTTQLRLDHDNYIPRLFKLCETVHKHGACISIQINHAGASALSSRTNMQPVSASNLPSKKGGEIPRPLTVEEIEQIAKKYGDAARRAQIAGFDSIEVHAGHSYLISQFLSPLTNNRTDEYGGSKENRARFAKLVMTEVRNAVGPDFPIMLRVSADEFLEGGNTLDDTLELLEYFGQEADILDVSAGLNGSIQYQIDANYLPDGWRSYMAKAVREKFNKPVITMGNIRDPKVAEDILARKDADLIGMGRGLIADPDWVNKVDAGQENTIRKCISCNIGCAGNRIGINRPIRCTINPAVNEGESYKEQQIKKPCNVVVIGAGTAGLEAACTSAEVGCTTFLLEKRNVLGGLAADISKIPDKKRLSDFPNYLIQRAKSLKNLYIFTDTEADTSFIESLNPNIIINATGSNPLLPPIKGLFECLNQEDTKVDTITGMIDKLNAYPEDLTGKKVVVIGGGAVGLDVVEYFAPRNADITIVEMQSVIGKDLDPVSKVGTAALMEKHHVTQLINTTLLEVKPESFILKHRDSEEETFFDYGFVCLGMRANNPIIDALHETFNDSDVEIINIGDSVRARRIIDGVLEGRNVLSLLSRKGFL
ncbi:2,4-dienoyl-CoA reductase-like NADH-dependent reductase (Old Yellow Enzyme family) [Lachnotalea glycerini]|uniref:2,4-dienoyl-CoA reductase-like NADH-dependent reductase (Old Yellow Enzyme family) n=1 Tax=Lachnotalea glycerini TaxID=1763509 RepID=A0A255IJT9_9FIRM|nr:FAD-dependent oxidoreductase [Lachnotalea glycerini]PXV89431.1 2,4-dienoyl-CoA reductase-like NADH-dependent reductase (Old Yellow Enzyme family) [Lachnotalea glycerini]RDY32380.1 FAD-dependent oxidoreductase [Lachnotalea glycerini]